MDGGLISEFVFSYSTNFVDNCLFGVSALWDSVWCSPAGFFRRENIALHTQKQFYSYVWCFFIETNLVCYQLEEPLSTPALIEFWWVPQIPEMVIPASSHDRSCLKESSQNVPTTITISESAYTGATTRTIKQHQTKKQVKTWKDERLPLHQFGLSFPTEVAAWKNSLRMCCASSSTMYVIWALQVKPLIPTSDWVHWRMKQIVVFSWMMTIWQGTSKRKSNVNHPNRSRTTSKPSQNWSQADSRSSLQTSQTYLKPIQKRLKLMKNQPQANTKPMRSQPKLTQSLLIVYR